MPVRLECGPEGSPNFCFGLYDTDTDECVTFVQSDWDYPGLASSFGWSPQHVQRCGECGGTAVGPNVGHCGHCDHAWEPCCDHGSDGTVDCRSCGVTVDEFLASAYDWLREHDGEEIDNPGYGDDSEHCDIGGEG